MRMSDLIVKKRDGQALKLDPVGNKLDGSTDRRVAD